MPAGRDAGKVDSCIDIADAADAMAARPGGLHHCLRSVIELVRLGIVHHVAAVVELAAEVVDVDRELNAIATPRCRDRLTGCGPYYICA